MALLRIHALRFAPVIMALLMAGIALPMYVSAQDTRLPATDRGGQAATDRGGQVATENNSTQLLNPLKADSLQELLVDVLRAVVQIGTIVLTFMIIWVGFLFVAARGNEEKIRDARRALFYTVIGGLILLGAQAIGMAIQSTVDSITR